MVVMAHGLEGHPNGTKIRSLRDAGFDVVAPDCRRLVVAQRIPLVEQAVAEGSPPLVLAGSSYGGLTALIVANRIDTSALAGLLLLAPALQRAEPPEMHPETLTVPTSLPCIVIHGTRDAIVPIELSRSLKQRSPHIELQEVDDEHRLGESLGQIAEAVRRLGG